MEQSPLVGTVFTLAWEPPAEAVSAAWVEVDGDRRQAVDGDAGEHVLVGLRAGEQATLRLVLETDAGTRVSDAVEVTAGPAPVRLPVLRAETLGAHHQPARLLTGLSSSAAAAILVDDEGVLTWWFESDEANTLGRVLPARAGGVWVAPINVDVVEDVVLQRVAWTGEVVEEVAAPWAHHDFVELPDGTLAWLAYAPGEVQGREVPGARIVEHGPGGDRVIFDAAEALGDATPPDLVGERWPHANALDYLPDRDAYLVSLMTNDAIIRVDRATGEVDWIAGGPLSTVADDEGETAFFDAQHQLQRLDDSLLVFVNGTAGQSESRVVELALDPDAGRAEEIWRYEPGLESPVMGDVQREDDGSTRVLFSFAGEAHELSADGSLQWRLQAELGAALSYATWLEPAFEE